ncbi:hypothetical protein ANS017_26540 [Paraclostridium bifermentans]|nr:XkdX family protein [Paraclostridium bifermentans]GKZ04083.1 hypothetical protein ANS014_25170 [Paraclostridium bifermentans]GKZ05542.1 hypothetical protein ANS015_04250 [Paraclostridium bifermentans]GKZ11270.1 hypothetical protein ANS017_26540 [Paraclostridium bifermentans]
MDWFNLISDYYKKGLWTSEQVKVCVEKGKITIEQYMKIVNGSID